MASFSMCSRLSKIPFYALSATNQSTKLYVGIKNSMTQSARLTIGGSSFRNLASLLNQDNPGNKSPPSESTATPESNSKDSPNARVEELTTRIGELDDKYKRALAETENVRTRMRRQIDDAKLFGIQGFCKDLLEVADILSKATESVPESALNGGNQHLKNLYDGLRMTDAQIQKVFRQHGLVQINPVGEKFDPNMHEALFEQVFEGKVPGTVAVVSKVGYSLHNRTIRPASVGVVKAA